MIGKFYFPAFPGEERVNHEQKKVSKSLVQDVLAVRGKINLVLEDRDIIRCY